ncbi:UNVERIFIED_CONTAM: class I SAM-dependent methyltransferase [Methylobacteriaceae bacterium AG10]|nr:class I SAM-dependent methyltransferase [Methylobacteriaceae bacterium AG10]
MHNNPWWTTNTRFAEYVLKCEDPNWDPFYDEIKQHVDKLNEIAFSFGDTIEGSIFNMDNATRDMTEVPEPKMLVKRRNYVFYVHQGRKMLEVGFNAGHSALLALTSNLNLQYVAVDLGNHPYSQPCFEYLKSLFGDRISMIVGNSLEVLPKIPYLMYDNADFDLWHIDGGHSYDVAEADLCNVLNMAKPGQTILFDDTSAHYIRGMIDSFIVRGYVSNLSFGWLWDPNFQMVLRVERNVGSR